MAKNNRNCSVIITGYIAGKKDGPNAVVKSYPPRNGQEAREYCSVFVNAYIGAFKAAINVEVPVWQLGKLLMVNRSSQVTFKGDLVLSEKKNSKGEYWWNLNNGLFLGELHDDREVETVSDQDPDLDGGDDADLGDDSDDQEF